MFRVGAHLLVKENHVFQSKGFSDLNCLGRFDVALEALARQAPDELVITSLTGQICEELLRNSVILNRVNIPVIIGGGAEKVKFNEVPVERALYNTAIFDSKALSQLRRSAAGYQSALAYLPFQLNGEQLSVFNSCSRDFQVVDTHWLYNLTRYFQELVFLDARGQGFDKGFDEKILAYLPTDLIELSYFTGGVTNSQVDKLRRRGAAGCIIDNVALYSNQMIFQEYHGSM